MLSGRREGCRFRDLVYSDFVTFRPSRRPSWWSVTSILASEPGMMASIILRAQQHLAVRHRARAANCLRTLGVWLVGADFSAGAQIGRSFKLVHPVGVVIGAGSRIGDNVTFVSGVTLAAQDHLGHKDPHLQSYPRIGDGVFIGAHAVVVGGVAVGAGATVGANAVVLHDVPPGATVVGAPARPTGAHTDGSGLRPSAP